MTRSLVGVIRWACVNVLVTYMSSWPKSTCANQTLGQKVAGVLIAGLVIMTGMTQGPTV